MKLINWCIFYVGVASALTLCTGTDKDSDTSWFVWLDAEPQHRHKTRTPVSSNCDRTWLWWIRSLVFSFLLSFFFLNPSVIGPGTPTPRPPQALHGGEEVCSVCQRRANVSAIISPPLFPGTEGEGRGWGRCLKARHTVRLSTLYRCWVLCDDQLLSWRMFPCQLKKYKIFFIPKHAVCLFFLYFIFSVTIRTIHLITYMFLYIPQCVRFKYWHLW